MSSSSWRATPPAPSPARCCRSTDGSEARLRRYQLPKHGPKPNAPACLPARWLRIPPLAVIGAGKTDADLTPTETGRSLQVQCQQRRQAHPAPPRSPSPNAKTISEASASRPPRLRTIELNAGLWKDKAANLQK